MNDALIREELSELAESFNTTVNELIPRIQQYKMATTMFGIVTSLVFIIITTIFFINLYKKAFYMDDRLWFYLTGMFLDLVFIIVLLFNAYNYIGWKYAPEVKTIEYVIRLVMNGK